MAGQLAASGYKMTGKRHEGGITSCEWLSGLSGGLIAASRCKILPSLKEGFIDSHVCTVCSTLQKLLVLEKKCCKMRTLTNIMS